MKKSIFIAFLTLIVSVTSYGYSNFSKADQTTNAKSRGMGWYRFENFVSFYPGEGVTGTPSFTSCETYYQYGQVFSGGNLVWSSSQSSTEIACSYITLYAFGECYNNQLSVAFAKTTLTW